MLLTTGYIQELDTKFMEMPYAGENNSISMYVFLPGKDIDSFLKGVTFEILNHVLFERKFDTPANCKANIRFPKIALQQKINLKPVNTIQQVFT